LKLLFDEQLSPALVRLLADIYPASSHVHLLGLGGSSDTIIWGVAAENGWIIVTKDADFQQRSLLLGSPPKVIWLRIGNCETVVVAALLRESYISVHHFHERPDLALLALPLKLP
jgi:predicted nuclease of predicted toxin-antitoxin system